VLEDFEGESFKVIYETFSLYSLPLSSISILGDYAFCSLDDILSVAVDSAIYWTTVLLLVQRLQTFWCPFLVLVHVSLTSLLSPKLESLIN
jgi:hypothetical protein